MKLPSKELGLLSITTMHRPSSSCSSRVQWLAMVKDLNSTNCSCKLRNAVLRSSDDMNDD
jgi:hypothetical protein